MCVVGRNDWQIRNVDLSQKLGELPSAVQPVLRKISTIPEIATAEEPSLPLDQLTVCVHMLLACPGLPFTAQHL